MNRNRSKVIIETNLGLKISDIIKEDFSDTELLLNSNYNEFDSFINHTFIEDEPMKQRYIRLTHPETSNKGYRIVWIENSQTNELMKVEIKNEKIEKSLNNSLNMQQSYIENDIEDPKDISDTSNLMNPSNLVSNYHNLQLNILNNLLNNNNTLNNNITLNNEITFQMKLIYVFIQASLLLLLLLLLLLYHFYSKIVKIALKFIDFLIIIRLFLIFFFDYF